MTESILIKDFRNILNKHGYKFEAFLQNLPQTHSPKVFSEALIKDFETFLINHAVVASEVLDMLGLDKTLKQTKPLKSVDTATVMGNTEYRIIFFVLDILMMTATGVWKIKK